MSDSVILSTVEKTRKDFKEIKQSYERKMDFLPSRVDAYVTDFEQIQKARKLICDTLDNINRFRTDCEVLIRSTDMICRPLLMESTPVNEVGEVAILLDEIVKAMKDAEASYKINVNGSLAADLGTISADPTIHSAAIQRFWAEKYRTMPGYSENQKRLEEETKQRKAAELVRQEEDVLYWLSDQTWLTVAELSDNTEFEFPKLSAILHRLMRQNKVQRIERSGKVLFAAVGVPEPKIEPKPAPEPVKPEIEKALESPVIAPTSPKKKKTRPIIIAIIACIVALAAAVVGINYYKQNENKKEQERKEEQERRLLLVEETIEQVLQDIEAGRVKKITFDEETKLAMEQCGIKSFFSVTDVREAIAKKFCQFYGKNDLDGLLEFLCFLSANYTYLISEGDVYDICFSASYLEELNKTVITNGVFMKVDGSNEIYTYNDAEFWRLPFGYYIKFEYTLNDENKSSNVILGDVEYRKDQHQKYKENSPGYFLVDETVELVEDKIENKVESSEKVENKYYPAARCPKCGTSFRANTMRARNIAERGYCGMGLCGPDR